MAVTVSLVQTVYSLFSSGEDGSAFAAPGFLRASYAASTETLREAVARLRRWAEGA